MRMMTVVSGVALVCMATAAQGFDIRTIPLDPDLDRQMRPEAPRLSYRLPSMWKPATSFPVGRRRHGRRDCVSLRTAVRRCTRTWQRSIVRGPQMYEETGKTLHGAGSCAIL